MDTARQANICYIAWKQLCQMIYKNERNSIKLHKSVDNVNSVRCNFDSKRSLSCSVYINATW